MKDARAQRLARAAGAVAGRASLRAIPLASGTHFPFQQSTVTAGQQMAYRSAHYFPKGGRGIRLLLSSVYAGAIETATATGFPLKLAAAIEPAPWSASKTYQPGDVVIHYATQYSQFSGGSDTFVSKPYFVAVNANTNSRPTPANADWTQTGIAFPTRVPITVGGVQDASFVTQTLPGGTTAPKGLILTEPLPLEVPVDGWLGVYSWLPCSGSLVAVAEGQSQNMALGPLVNTGSSVPDATTATLGGSGLLGGSITSSHMRPAGILGQPITATPSVVIVGDSISEGKSGGSAVTGVSIVSGGTGYKVGDIPTTGTSGATAGAQAAGSTPRVVVDRVDASGTITVLHVIDGGAFTSTATQTGQTLPSGAQSLSGGTGTGATGTLSFGANAFDVGDTLGGQGYIERALLAAKVPYMALTASGDRANLWTGGRAQTRYAAAAQSGAKNAILALGRNDFTAGDSAAIVIANILTIAAALRGCGIEKVFIATVTPETTSTTAAGQSTLADQVVTSNNAARATYNANIRTNWQALGFAGLVDVAATIEDGGAGAPTGKFAVIGGQPAAADGKHPGPTAITAMQAAVTAIVPALAP